MNRQLPDYKWASFFQCFGMEEKASLSYTQIKSFKKKNLAGLVAVFDRGMLRITLEEEEQDRVNAAHSPLCE